MRRLSFCTTCLTLSLGGGSLPAGDAVDFTYAIFNKGTIPLQVFKDTTTVVHAGIGPNLRVSGAGSEGVVLSVTASGASDFVFKLESVGFAVCQEADGVVSCDTVFGWPLHASDIDRALFAHLYGESTWAGERDVRFLNCLVIHPWEKGFLRHGLAKGC
ncbi:unnamed protein product [Polarella glacialis]|uniref:Subtilisin n=1 Tax=Polarella glacialis TaxID=89957 RepID=A0A813K6M2_POLGL|nr:unnamed protein product [Polarella glacialis]